MSASWREKQMWSRRWVLTCRLLLIYNDRAQLRESWISFAHMSTKSKLTLSHTCRIFSTRQYRIDRERKGMKLIEGAAKSIPQTQATLCRRVKVSNQATLRDKISNLAVKSAAKMRAPQQSLNKEDRVDPLQRGPPSLSCNQWAWSQTALSSHRRLYSQKWLWASKKSPLSLKRKKLGVINRWTLRCLQQNWNQSGRSWGNRWSILWFAQNLTLKAKNRKSRWCLSIG